MPRKGYKQTPEHRARIATGLLVREFTEAHCLALSEANRGKHHSRFLEHHGLRTVRVHWTDFRTDTFVLTIGSLLS